MFSTLMVESFPQDAQGIYNHIFWLLIMALLQSMLYHLISLYFGFLGVDGIDIYDLNI